MFAPINPTAHERGSFSMHTKQIPVPSPHHMPTAQGSLAHEFLLSLLSTKTLAAPVFSTLQFKNESYRWANKAKPQADRTDSCIATHRDFSILSAYKPHKPSKSLGTMSCAWLHLQCQPSPSTLKASETPAHTLLVLFLLLCLQCLETSSRSHKDWEVFRAEAGFHTSGKCLHATTQLCTKHKTAPSDNSLYLPANETNFVYFALFPLFTLQEYGGALLSPPRAASQLSKATKPNEDSTPYTCQNQRCPKASLLLRYNEGPHFKLYPSSRVPKSSPQQRTP